MADEVKTGTELTEELEEGQQPETPSSETEGAQEEDEQPSVEALASEMGWKPKEAYTGPPESWRPAHEFIRAGPGINKARNDEIRNLRSQIDVIARTSAQIAQDSIERQREKLVAQYNELVEDGKAADAFKVSEKLHKLDTAPTPAANAPPAEVQDFVAKHANWYGRDRAATMRAQEVSDRLAANGASVPEQLAAAERVVKAEYPDLFKGQVNGQHRQAPLVSQPGHRGAALSNRAKTFNDMPKAAQDVANDMVERGVIANKDDYTKRYWDNANLQPQKR